MHALRLSTVGLAIAAAVSPVAAQAPTVRLQSFSVIVPDYEEAKAWYTQKLGFVVVRDQAFGTDERFILVAAPGQPETGIVLQKSRINRRPDEPTMPTDYTDRVGKTVNIVLLTSDVTAFADGLVRRGVTLDAPPKQYPWSAQATFRDLYGNTFVVVGPLTAKKPGA